MRGTLQKVSAIPAFVNFAAGGAAIAVLGVLILEALVRVGLLPLVAQAVQLTITLILNFVYNYKVTWRDRPRTGLRRQAGLFLATRAATQAASWFGFALLTSHGLHYQLANATCLAGAMTINFVTSDKLVFRSGKDTQQTQPAFRQLWNGSRLHNRGKALKPRPPDIEWIHAFSPQHNNARDKERTNEVISAK
jgi:putative flippase GtrA